jgi:hypothetical protein
MLLPPDIDALILSVRLPPGLAIHTQEIVKHLEREARR